MVFPKKDVFWVKEWGMEGEEARSGGGIRTGVREQRGRQDSLALARASCSLPRGRCQAEKPRPVGALSFFCWRPFASELAWVPTKKTIATVVTTVSRLGGEDKTFDIIPCEIV